jgi:hypothetical protein
MEDVLVTRVVGTEVVVVAELLEGPVEAGCELDIGMEVVNEMQRG